MKYRKLGKTGIKALILGFGAMRLPQNSTNPEDINITETKKMVEYAVEYGINIYDTALLYHTNVRKKAGKSETILGQLLKEHPEVYISTKMPSWNITSWEYFNKTLDYQLQQLQKDTIELFFIHSIKDSYYENIKETGLYEFIDRALEDGRIKHVGFSTHASEETLDKIIKDYRKWEFALTQINYLDNTENPGLNGLKKLHKLNMGTMIMEPLRGGQLAQNQPKQIQEIFKQSKKQKTPIDWAFNYLWNKKEVNCVLSGMNSLEQVKQNIKLTDKAEIGMITQEEEKIYEKIKEEYEKLKNIPCTSCNYCMPCPHGVNIPKCFQEYNLDIISGNENEAIQYRFHLNQDRKAHNCTQCGACFYLCLQQINIPLQLKKVEEHFGE